MPEEDERRKTQDNGAPGKDAAAATEADAMAGMSAAAEGSPGSPSSPSSRGSSDPRSATEVPGILDGLSPWERDYRAATLAAIERHVREEGPHEAKPDPRRARQFMPFAALKGYGDLTREREDEAASDEE